MMSLLSDNQLLNSNFYAHNGFVLAPWLTKITNLYVPVFLMDLSWPTVANDQPPFNLRLGLINSSWN